MGSPDGYLLSDSDPENRPQDAESNASRLRLSGQVARRNEKGVARLYWDDLLPGFGLRVYATGTKRWIVQLRQRGVSRRITLGGPAHLNAGDARRAARGLLAKNALDGVPQRPARPLRSEPKFTDYIEEFWRDYARHWKRSTQQRNRTAIEKTLKPWFGRYRLASINRAHILEWKDSLHERQGVFNRALPVLAVMLGYAEGLGHRAKGSNPCRGIPRYKRQLPERYLTAKEYRRLAQALADREADWPDAVAAIRLLIYTGARRSEITSLHWEWIEPPYAHLPDSKTGPRRLYLNRQALAVLEARKRPEAGQGPILATRSGRVRALEHGWPILRRMAAIPDVRLHDLRHSFASVGIMDGISLARVGKLLGHVLPETTARYAHLADAAIADAAERVSGSIAAALGLRP
ncbi:integrase [Sphingopyxis bauzanensis]|uniref:Integrase n=1 Tax=Sphingopyxis bauzanensis TaxID=651663 RepID=A0A246JWT8_9SPHN|nr:site-specific integrase [Sphingopyxis bauzanensis]OWQ97539.1 integrase [Sphingopyxis bauzanensis]GGJ56451.1 integrase [Sphingopyxis bauzanensis]